ncbi:hypothetical protein DKG34_38705 [Streptomyces sp. NWU49]|uniref:DUF6907 domain-containing protein n=1 Tax=Streptomyces sp. NWU49 TaxID=2201153 RepID=UPI000D6835BE|nr:hypothetical protein [Streptomyces sp. NWU49]PWJ02410.1 hypothetical protein DKG34_38705 [Streptomyces sp. NWU49]
MTTMPPTFGPTEIHGDDEHIPHAIVQVAIALPREQLRAALAVGHAQMSGEPPLEDMTVLDVRREIEGYLAAGAVFELYREADALNERLAPEHTAALDAAIDRAYTLPAPGAPAPVRKQDPRYRDGTVILQTLDQGEVTVPEPAWCRGHDDDLVGYLADVTHNGPTTTARTVTARHGHMQVMEARITQAPHAKEQPEPLPLLAIHVDIDATVATEDGRHLAQALRVAARRIDRTLGDLARLRGEKR